MFLPFEGGVGIGVHVVDGGGLRQSGEEGGFGQIERGGVLAKIGLRGGFDAVGQIAVIDFVEIEFEDLIFGVAAVDFGGENDLANFALEAVLVARGLCVGPVALGQAEVEGARELLGDGGCAAQFAAGAIGAIDCLENGGDVEAGMAVVVAVFGGDGGGDQKGRNFVYRHARAAAFVGIVYFVQLRAGRVVDVS